MSLQPDSSLTLGALLSLLERQHGDSEIVSVAGGSGRRTRILGRELAARASSLAAGLESFGLAPGARVATLAWNVQEHLECFWAVPCAGGVVQALNPRLPAEMLAATINRSGARILIFQVGLGDLADAIRARAPNIDIAIAIGRSASPDDDAVDYETLVCGQAPRLAWPEVSEHDGAGLCFTSGTTGPPKGVVYTHRALILHALTMAAFDPYSTPRADRVLAVVPFFHAMGWNLPYIAALTGSDLVLPGRHLAPEDLAPLMLDEAITFTSGVPTVWATLIDYLDQTGAELPALRTIACGGSRVPESLMRRYEERGVTVLQGWGMTETGPGAARVVDDPALPPSERWRRRNTAGRVRPLHQIRLRGPDGDLLSHDGQAAGEIEIRGPFVIREYFDDPAANADRFRDGWLRTGDIGTIDPHGWLRIVDRAKDLIKSGGEWISSLELEAALLEHPHVTAVAVIPIPDERWIERPLPCLVAQKAVTASELRTFLLGRLPRWCVPERYAWVAGIPSTPTGKHDKRALRKLLEEGSLDVHLAR